MNFKQRLFRYLIGIGLGLLLSYFFFSDRADLLTSWLPGPRVIDRLQASHWSLSEEMKCRMDCNDLSISALKEDMEGAQVDFQKSNPRQEPKSYFIKLDNIGTDLSMEFSVMDTIATLIGIESTKACSCP